MTFGGNSLTATWSITDLCLWCAAGAGLGLAEYEQALASYLSGYIDMLRTHRTVMQAVTVTGATMTSGVFEWPRGSGNNYIGVETALTVKELS